MPIEPRYPQGQPGSKALRLKELAQHNMRSDFITTTKIIVFNHECPLIFLAPSLLAGLLVGSA